MKQVKRQIVRIEGTESYWFTGTSNKTIVGLEFVKEEGQNIGTLNMDKLSGPDLTVNEFENILCSNVSFIESVKEYANYKRVNKFYIKKNGFDYLLYTTSNCNNTSLVQFNSSKLRSTIHVSTFDKVPLSYISNIWIGDLIEILLEIDPKFELKLNIAKAMFNTYSEAELEKAAKEKLGVLVVSNDPKCISSYNKFYPKYRNVIEDKIKDITIEALMDKLNNADDMKHLCSPTCTTIHLKGEHENKRDKKRVERARRELHDPEGITPLDEEEDPWL